MLHNSTRLLPGVDRTGNPPHPKYNCIVELSAFFEAAAIGLASCSLEVRP
jgi:hypothetical protein